MSTPLRPARSLPAVPNLEQQKKQARELLDAARAHDPEAVRRFRTFHPRLRTRPAHEWSPSQLALHDAQLVLAREYGFTSWPAFKAHIEATVASRRTRPFVRELDYYEDRAHGLVAVLADGAPSTLDQVRSWHPGFADASDDAIVTAALSGRFDIEDARLVYAREHGHAKWADFAEHIRLLGAGEATDSFMDVLEAGRRGDWDRAKRMLHDHPDLVRARGTNGNTLLNLACSLVACPVPEALSDPTIASSDPDRLAPVHLLITAGADTNQGNDRGWTPLHQAGYRNDPGMVKLLLEAGARPDSEAHGEGGTPLAVALFWGHRESAGMLATAGVMPRNLRVAAGLGRTDLIGTFFTKDGQLAADAGIARGFYRPHSGFPAWRPSNDPREILDEALVWAAKAGRIEAISLLVERGARLDADPYRGTPLLWAAANGRVETVRCLIDLGANVNLRATFGGPSHGQGVTAIHLAAQNNHREVAALLLARGADPMIQDNLYGGTAISWARHFGSAEVASYLEGEAHDTSQD